MLLLLGPVLVPWYVVWAMPLVWLLPRAPRVALIGAGVLLAVAQWATESVNYPAAFSADLLIGRWLITPVIILMLVWMLADLKRRLRAGLPLECEEEDIATAAGHG